MKLDVTKKITDLDGAALKEGERELTLSMVICNALMISHQSERELSGDEKVKRFVLATRIHGAALPVDVSAEEAALIKKLVAMAYGPLVVGQVWQAVEGHRPNGAGAEPEVMTAH